MDRVADAVPLAIGGECFHEVVGDEDREVEIAETSRIALGIDEGFDIGVVDREAAHHCAAPLARRHDRAAHRIPAIHEGQRSRGIGANPQHRASRGADG